MENNKNKVKFFSLWLMRNKPQEFELLKEIFTKVVIPSAEFPQSDALDFLFGTELVRVSCHNSADNYLMLTDFGYDVFAYLGENGHLGFLDYDSSDGFYQFWRNHIKSAGSKPV